MVLTPPPPTLAEVAVIAGRRPRQEHAHVEATQRHLLRPEVSHAGGRNAVVFGVVIVLQRNVKPA